MWMIVSSNMLFLDDESWTLSWGHSSQTFGKRTYAPGSWHHNSVIERKRKKIPQFKIMRPWNWQQLVLLFGSMETEDFKNSDLCMKDPMQYTSQEKNPIVVGTRRCMNTLNEIPLYTKWPDAYIFKKVWISKKIIKISTIKIS